jgi:hypothetical protein
VSVLYAEMLLDMEFVTYTKWAPTGGGFVLVGVPESDDPPQALSAVRASTENRKPAIFFLFSIIIRLVYQVKYHPR